MKISDENLFVFLHKMTDFRKKLPRQKRSHEIYVRLTTRHDCLDYKCF